MSVDELIRERLETLVEPVDDRAVLARIEQLAAGMPPAAPRRPGGRTLLGAAAVVAIVAAIGVGVARMGDSPGRAEVLAGPATTASTGSDVAPVSTASVEVTGEFLGAIEITTSPLVATDSDDVHSLAEHVLTFTNTGEESVHLGDVRTASAVAAGANVGPSLFVGTEGCGYSFGSGVPAVPSCNRNFDPIGELAPGESVDLTVYLWFGIAGMEQLDDGERVFRLAVPESDEPIVDPAQRRRTIGDVVITYRNLTTLED